ncbi:MAG: alkaline phosphatase family protein [Rubrobacter sp.]|nr:alkaline phosphatase family protein [Rubrobacter sp.]
MIGLLHPKPALLLALDGIRPDVLRAAIREGDAPNLGAIAKRGEAVWDAVSVFPSITPAATAAIATGESPAGSGILGHAWYDRNEERVIVYGAKTGTVIGSGPIKVFHNNVWRMNRDHLSAPTIFEDLHDSGIDGACVNFPVRRGPHAHPVRMKSVQGYMKNGRYLGNTVDGPKEYYMGDLFYSRPTVVSGRKGSGGLRRSAGINDEYAAEVGAMFLKEKPAPFNLVYFFKGDSITHHQGLAAQRAWVPIADAYVGRIFEAGGGVDQVLDEYAVLALSDHGHDPLHRTGRFVELGEAGNSRIATGPNVRFGPGVDALAVQNGRAAMIYLKDPTAAAQEAVADRFVNRRGVDLAAWVSDGWLHVRRPSRELRFRPGVVGPSDSFGRRWQVRGDLLTLDLTVADGGLRCGDYPDALERLWGSLTSPRCGDVVLSATPGHTFGEVTGGYHEASDHGSLHANDSNVFVLASGVAAPQRITDVAPTLLEHFGANLQEERIVV